MRILLAILISIHGIIHLFGFLKAFGISEFNAITQPISKPFGIIWLMAFILFLTTLVLFLIQHNGWWMIGILAVLLSQFLIILYWQDAKFGTLINLIIITSILIAYSSYDFKKKINGETVQMLTSSEASKKTIVSEQMITDLPTIVQKWVVNSGILGKELVQNVYLEQDLQMLMKPEQQNWNNAKARQYFTIQPPGFNWTVNLKMNLGLSLVGRDKFENGKGEMTIKLFSLIPIVNSKNSEKINQATLQRYLAEIVWFPSAALSRDITWDPVDDFSARATMEYNGTKGSGVFHFDASGNFKKFVTMRFKDEKDSQPTQWSVLATKTEEIKGIKIPVELKANWKLENGDWTWLKLKITDIAYNTQKIPVPNNPKKP
ncbi:DUF6920 family protein [Kriegella aquimaris]|uniref:Uncharacterized protein n=1 Tax=Kriegella aquimaris TaxID=192904 RepID=A0A1G9XLR4_9FLAO|nr:DUF6544 family protein [Kriegella aquimaris]SDM97697.1 hypothetical protein SAMN04488514_11868 [Kriegella aquimaris]